MNYEQLEPGDRLAVAYRTGERTATYVGPVDGQPSRAEIQYDEDHADQTSWIHRKYVRRLTDEAPVKPVRDPVELARAAAQDAVCDDPACLFADISDEAVDVIADAALRVILDCLLPVVSADGYAAKHEIKRMRDLLG